MKLLGFFGCCLLISVYVYDFIATLLGYIVFSWVIVILLYYFAMKL